MSAPILEQSCPACGGRFTVGAASRRKKVQCPQCREVVTLSPPSEMNATPETASPPAPDWRARCEMLQARIEALEQQVETLMVSPRLHSSLLHEFSPVARERLPPDDPRENPPPTGEAAPCKALARNFQPAIPEIGLRIAADDEAARRLAATLTGILVGAGWTVRGVTEDPAPAPPPHGLTLIAAPTLPLARVTATLHALREAGFAIAFQLDPQREPSETLLIVGAGAGSDNKTALES